LIHFYKRYCMIMKLVILIFLTVQLSLTNGEDPCDKQLVLETERLWNLMSANETSGVIDFFWNDAFHDLQRSRRKCVQKIFSHFVLYYSGNKSMAERFEKDNISYFPSNVTKKAEDYKKTRMTIDICGDNSFIIFEWHFVTKEAPGHMLMNLDENHLLDLPHCSFSGKSKFKFSTSLGLVVSLLIVLVVVIIFCFLIAKKKQDEFKECTDVRKKISLPNERLSELKKNKDKKSLQENTRGEAEKASNQNHLGKEDSDSKILVGEKTIMKKGPRDHWKIKHVDVDTSAFPSSKRGETTEAMGVIGEENLLTRDKEANWKMQNVDSSSNS